MIFPLTPLLNIYHSCRVSDFSPDRLIAINNVFSLEEQKSFATNHISDAQTPLEIAQVNTGNTDTAAKYR
jgi:hypothetical protein